LYTREGTPREGKAFLDWLNTTPFPLSNLEHNMFQAFARNTFLTTAPTPSTPIATASTATATSSTPAPSPAPATDGTNTEINEDPSGSNKSKLPRDPYHFFRIGKRSSPAQVSALSAIVHVCALACAHGNEHPIFHKMLFAPADLANVFIPSLPDDEMQMFMGIHFFDEKKFYLLTFVFFSCAWWWLV
jgi:hypothetical protein